MEDFVRVGMGLPQDKDFSATWTQRGVADAFTRIRAAPGMWVSRQRTLTMEEIPARQRKWRELRWQATVSRPDICARLAQLASKIHSLQGVDLH